jgi:hypothetical protein
MDKKKIKKVKVKTELDILLENIVKNKRTAIGLLKRKNLETSKRKEIEDFITVLNGKRDKILLNKQKDKIEQLLETKPIFAGLTDALLHEVKETKMEIDELKNLIKLIKKDNNPEK